MSEERRKRNQGRSVVNEKLPGLSREVQIWVGIAVIAALCYAGYWYYINHRYDNFAKCLATKQAKMYGLFWCPHCADQKKKFGKAFQYVPYQECATKARALEPVCAAAGVKLFPSWQFGSNPPKEGVFEMDELSDKTGCPLP